MRVFKITDYDMHGDLIQVFEPMPTLEKIEHNGRVVFVDKETQKEAFKTHLWSYTTDKPLNAISHEEKYLPYIADVIEDLPGGVKFEPRRYRDCQLMVEKHGGYKQFYHKPSNSVLRIAINSNTYEVPNIVKVGLKANAEPLFGLTNGFNHGGHTDLPNHGSVIKLDTDEFDNFINIIQSLGYNLKKSLYKNHNKKHGNCDYSCYLMK